MSTVKKRNTGCKIQKSPKYTAERGRVSPPRKANDPTCHGKVYKGLDGKKWKSIPIQRKNGSVYHRWEPVDKLKKSATRRSTPAKAQAKKSNSAVRRKSTTKKRTSSAAKKRTSPKRATSPRRTVTPRRSGKGVAAASAAATATNRAATSRRRIGKFIGKKPCGDIMLGDDGELYESVKKGGKCEWVLASDATLRKIVNAPPYVRGETAPPSKVRRGAVTAVKNETWFKPNSDLTDQQKRYCECTLDEGLKGNIDNPWALCTARVGMGKSNPDCARWFNYENLPTAELLYLAREKVPRGSVKTRADALKIMNDWHKSREAEKWVRTRRPSAKKSGAKKRSSTGKKKSTPRKARSGARARSGAKARA